MTPPTSASARTHLPRAFDPEGRGAPTGPRRALVAALLLATPLLGGCQAVDFTERRRLADPIMQLDDGPTQTHLDQKVYYSREGSAGGIGASAGGGCGCY